MITQLIFPFVLTFYLFQEPRNLKYKYCLEKFICFFLYSVPITIFVHAFEKDKKNFGSRVLFCLKIKSDIFLKRIITKLINIKTKYCNTTAHTN